MQLMRPQRVRINKFLWSFKAEADAFAMQLRRLTAWKQKNSAERRFTSADC